MKRISALILVVVLILSMTTTAFARHGYVSGTTKAQQTYAACNVQNCTEAGKHYHDGVCYYGNCTQKNYSGGCCAR